MVFLNLVKLTIQQPIAAAKNSAWIGRIVDVLIEKKNPQTGEMIGRCSRFAPEIDGEVRLQIESSYQALNPGMIVPTLITGADLYDLNGKIVNNKSMTSNF